MVTEAEFSRAIPVSEIGAGAFERRIEADADERAALAKRFELVALGQLKATLSVRSDGDAIVAEGRFQAEVVQSCVVSGDPVPAMLDEPVLVRFITDGAHAPDAEIELEAEDCDTMFFDGKTIDLGEAVAQSLLLALDPFPRGPNADAYLKEAGVKGEDEAGPFGALAALKDKLGKG